MIDYHDPTLSGGDLDGVVTVFNSLHQCTSKPVERKVGRERTGILVQLKKERGQYNIGQCGKLSNESNRTSAQLNKRELNKREQSNSGQCGKESNAIVANLEMRAIQYWPQLKKREQSNSSQCGKESNAIVANLADQSVLHKQPATDSTGVCR